MTLKSQTTPWFNGTVKPVRPGAYERQYMSGKMPYKRFCWWDGQSWYMGDVTPALAEKCVNMGPAARQQLPWRGLTNDES